jgi:alpha-glucosidase
MARATFEGLARLQPTRRPFVITRAGYAGIQRYSTMWTGDNNASFESLALNIPMFTSLGLSGESFVGSDLPGFIGRGDGELLARSYEVAFLVPLCRNHGAVDQYDHEPWRYGAPYEAIVRKYLKLRYRLLPFLYTTLEEAHRTGMPLFRPLLLNFQDDPNTLNLDDEFMIGDALLAAPVVHAGERAREIYLPRGLWYDFWTGHVVDAPRPSGESIDAAAVRTDGSQFFRVDVPLDHVPLYVRGGTVVPSTEPMNYVTEKTWSPIRFDVYPDEHGNASGSLYEDDGLTPDYEKGVCRRTTLSLSRTTDGDQLTIAAPEGNYRPASRNFEIIVHGGNVAPHALVLDHHPLEIVSATTGDTGWWRDDAGGIHVRIQDDSSLHTLLLRP